MNIESVIKVTKCAGCGKFMSLMNLVHVGEYPSTRYFNKTRDNVFCSGFCAYKDDSEYWAAYDELSDEERYHVNYGK